MTYFTVVIACMLSSLTNAENTNKKTETLRKPVSHVQMNQHEMDQILKQGIADLEKFQQVKNRSRIG